LIVGVEVGIGLEVGLVVEVGVGVGAIQRFGDVEG
jgi:hypothetical protein